MAIAQSMLPEFDHEMTTTRTLLERLPEDKASWKPHPKSYSMSDLAVHISNLPLWAVFTIAKTELDLNPPGGPVFEPPKWDDKQALLQKFDENVRRARDALAGTSDADIMQTWTLKNGGNTVLAMPRVAVLRSFVMNHLIHHRGVFSLYLRLNDVPLPPIYGPTADSPM